MLLSGAPGWGAVPGGANFGTAFLASGGRSAIAAQQANQAAQGYAMRQQEMQRRTEMDKMRQAVMESEIARNSRPMPEPKPEKPSAWVPQSKEDVEWLERLKASLKTTKGGASAKPPRAAVANRIDIINQADVGNPEHRFRLEQIIKNPATPEEKQAALLKLIEHITIRPK